MPKLIKENTGQEVRSGTYTSPNGDRINVGSLTRWSDGELNRIGIRRQPDPPPPPPPRQLSPRQRLDREVSQGSVMRSVVEVLAELKGVTYEEALDDLAARM